MIDRLLDFEGSFVMWDFHDSIYGRDICVETYVYLLNKGGLKFFIAILINCQFVGMCSVIIFYLFTCNTQYFIYHQPCSKKVAACAKHYLGDGGTTKGINENNTVINQNGLFSIHMPAYYNSIVKGVATIMVSYSSWNGVKMHANRELVTSYLKNTLRFRVNSYRFLLLFSKEIFHWTCWC